MNLIGLEILLATKAHSIRSVAVCVQTVRFLALPILIVVFAKNKRINKAVRVYMCEYVSLLNLLTIKNLLNNC